MDFRWVPQGDKNRTGGFFFKNIIYFKLEFQIVVVRIASNVLQRHCNILRSDQDAKMLFNEKLMEVQTRKKPEGHTSAKQTPSAHSSPSRDHKCIRP